MDGSKKSKHLDIYSLLRIDRIDEKYVEEKCLLHT